MLGQSVETVFVDKFTHNFNIVICNFYLQSKNCIQLNYDEII